MVEFSGRYTAAEGRCFSLDKVKSISCFLSYQVFCFSFMSFTLGENGINFWFMQITLMGPPFLRDGFYQILQQMTSGPWLWRNECLFIKTMSISLLTDISRYHYDLLFYSAPISY